LVAALAMPRLRIYPPTIALPRIQASRESTSSTTALTMNSETVIKTSTMNSLVKKNGLVSIGVLTVVMREPARPVRATLVAM
jgi:hypothetical protein